MSHITSKLAALLRGTSLCSAESPVDETIEVGESFLAGEGPESRAGWEARATEALRLLGLEDLRAVIRRIHRPSCACVYCEGSE